MMNIFYNIKKNGINIKILGPTGFTLIEVLIAGVILMGVMSFMSRITVASLNVSSNLNKRNIIENKIIENIQLLHQADAGLIINDIIEEGCNNPPLELFKVIEADVPLIDGVNRTIDIDDNILIVTYIFNPPETSIEIERRIVELSPNFTTYCP